MSDDLKHIEDWAEGLLAKLEPAERRKVTRTIGRELRRSQQRRIMAQKNPDGSAFEARKPQKGLRNKKGRAKRKMFTKLRTARYLKIRASAQGVSVGYSGRAAYIARIHQYGLRGKVNKQGVTTRYARRRLLGFTRDDREMISDLLITHLMD